MRIAICDDEKEMCLKLKGLIRRGHPGCETACFTSGRQLLEAHGHFDMIFLDIQMEGLNGIETAKRLRRKDEQALLIFVTALKEYVFEAFDVSAFHYLLKPVSAEQFDKVFARAWQEAERIRKSREDQIFFQTKSRKIMIQKRDILYVESRRRKVDIHTVRECITVYATMAGLEEQLGENFYRCHRGYLVNLEHVTEYSADTVQLKNGEAVYMAREKYPQFVKAYMRYLRAGGIVHV